MKLEGFDCDIEKPVTVGLDQVDLLIAIGSVSVRTTRLILSAASSCMRKQFAASIAAAPGQESEVGSFHVCLVESERLVRGETRHACGDRG
jgi:hypothetical protein